jgi:hypothetical protein
MMTEMFIRKNYEWLNKWFKHVNPCHVRPDYREGGKKLWMQIFVRTYDCELDGDFLEEHKKDILYGAVFGRLNKGRDSDGGGREMRGFLEMVGRMPNEEDKVGFVCFVNRMRFLELNHPRIDGFQSGASYYVTECGLWLRGEA